MVARSQAFPSRSSILNFTAALSQMAVAGNYGLTAG
jgi:hypothetical protein